MRRLSRCACAMTLEIPEIDSKGQSAHLCFYLLMQCLLFPSTTILFSRCMSATADLFFISAREWGITAIFTDKLY